MYKVKKFLINHPLFFLLFLGLILRFAMLFLDFSFDVNSFMTWGRDAFVLGFSGFYEKQSSAVFANLSPNYPPLAIYLFYLSYGLYTLVNAVAWKLNILFPLFPSKLIFFLQTRSTMAAFFKLPAIFADLGIAFIIALIVQKIFPIKKKYPLVAASLILFNPAFFYNSAYWGQTEAIPIFLLLLSFYFLLLAKKTVRAGISFTLALLAKQNAFVFIPVFLWLFFTRFKKDAVIKGVISSTIIFWIAFFPFYKTGNPMLFPFITYFQKILGSSGLPYISNYAFNFWALISQWKDIVDTRLFFGLSYRYWGYLLTGFFALIILWREYRRKQQTAEILFAVGLIAYASFLFLTKIHERHFEQVLPFLIPVALRDKKILTVFVLLSLFHFFNLYHNWPVPKVDFLVSAIRSPLAVNFFILTFLGSFFSLLFYYFDQMKKA